MFTKLIVDGSRDSCQGDSGGPMMCQNQTTGSWEIHGIISFAYSCGVNPGTFYKEITSLQKCRLLKTQ